MPTLRPSHWARASSSACRSKAARILSLADIAPRDLPKSIHATAVSCSGKGLLITGPSGSGKSSLALQLMVLGAGLISDDLTQLSFQNDGLVLARPDTTAPFGIEARGLGLLSATRSLPAPLYAVLDLSQTSAQRLPPPAQIEIAGTYVQFIKKVDNPAFPAMLMQYLSQGMMPT